MKKIYEIQNLEKSFGQGDSKVNVLKGVSLDVEEGEILTILGPSGSGKSTFLNIIGALDQSDSGKVMYDGEDINGMSKRERIMYRRKEIGFIFQFYNLLSNLNAKENIESCQCLSENPIGLEEIMENLGLTEHQKKFPKQLSGGQQQRVSFARALVKNPKVLLCDEPTGALDYNMSKEILKLLEKINQQYKTTIIIVTHNEAIKEMSHHVVKMKDGKIIENYKNEELKKAEDIDW